MTHKHSQDRGGGGERERKQEYRFKNIQNIIETYKCIKNPKSKKKKKFQFYFFNEYRVN